MDVYINEHRIPWDKFVSGANYGKLLTLAFNRARDGRQYPQVALVNVPPQIAHHNEYTGLYEIKTSVVNIPDEKDSLGLRTFQTQIVLTTRDWNVLDTLQKGGVFAVQGVVTTEPLFLEGTVKGIREGTTNPKDRILDMRMHIMNEKSMTDAAHFVRSARLKWQAECDVATFESSQRINLLRSADFTSSSTFSRT